MTMRRAAIGFFMLAGALAQADRAEACGGCFAPPQTIQVVTDHRMVLSLSRDRTVLWDQFRYSGRPEDFSWILPIRNGPGVIIEEADNLFLQAVDDVAAPIVNPAPFPSCNLSGSRGGLFGSADSAGATAAPSSPDAGVSVISEQVVGPYQVATLAATDPAALRTWLRSNGYSVPAPIEPVIDHYVNLSMDFVAVRLRPTADITQMKPLRIITPGYNPSLPLRMIAAGVADKVGLVLTVISEARVEAMNFPNGEVRDADLVWDYDAPSSSAEDFLNQFNRINRANQNRVWLTESAGTQTRFALDTAMQQRCGGRFGGPVRPDCLDARVNPPDTQVAFQPFGDAAFVTRLRADLNATALDRDLQLAASDRGARSRTYNYGVLRNDPCTTPRTKFEGCSARPGAAGTSGLAALCVAALAACVARRRR
ncbi:MAG: DUF2330 domain-containing protein [Polyangiales bacterium]